MFDEQILYKIFANERMQNVPVAYQNEVIRAIEEVLEEEAKEYPYLYLAHTFQGNITENLREE